MEEKNLVKYKSKKVVIDGHEFPSKMEGNRYIKLREMQRENKISDLELQPPFLLQEGFTRDGKKYRPITYVADFRYKIGDKVVVEDVKGFKTPEYKLKKKLLLYKYGGFEFKETK